MTGTASTWPAPLKPHAYHGILGEIVRTLEPETESDPAGLLLQLACMLGSVIGRSAHFRVGAGRHALNLFVGVVGDTAKGRKGLSNDTAVHVFETIDDLWVRGCRAHGLSSGEGLIWQVRDAIEKQQPIKQGGRVVDYQQVVEDPGVEDKRLLVTEAELASTLKVMGREGNTLSPIIRQAWDGHDLRTLTKSSPARATAPHISIIGMITGTELRRYLDTTEAANGFGNRFLWCAVRRSKELPDGGRELDLAPQIEQLRRAVAHGRAVGEIRRDADAGRIWHAIYGPLSAGRPGMLGSMTARAEAQVMRLACLFAVGDISYFVTPRHLRAALEVWRYAFQSARRLFGDRLGDPTADAILQALTANYPAALKKSEISALFNRNKSATEINRALDLLKEHRLAQQDLDRDGEGRPRELWFASQPDYEINEIDELTQLVDRDISFNSSISSGEGGRDGRF